ncbi:hypothetical protein C8R44DRAFT_728954 [Mycena epipterygia]|nr:hypothetical protein C8R44DRAFT_728954 [Mycena epipterygia]
MHSANYHTYDQYNAAYIYYTNMIQNDRTGKNLRMAVVSKCCVEKRRPQNVNINDPPRSVILREAPQVEVTLEKDRARWALTMGVPIQKILPPSSLVRPTRHEVVEYGLLDGVWERLVHLQRERRAHDRMQAADDGQGGSRPSTRVQLDEGAIPGGRQYVDSGLRRDGEVGKRTRQKLEVEVPAEVEREDVSTGRGTLDRRGAAGGFKWGVRTWEPSRCGAVPGAEAAHSVRTSMKNIGSALTGSPVEFGEEGTWHAFRFTHPGGR